MSPKNTSNEIDGRIDYVKNILESMTNRRDSLENKCSILLATNAILISAIIGIGFPIVINNVNQGITILKLSLTVFSLIFVIISTLFATNILIPIFSEKQRKRILGLPEREHNLFWFGAIAGFNRNNFINDIFTISKEEILSQTITESYNLSRILVKRYNLLSHAVRFFIFSMILFASLSLINLLQDILINVFRLG